MPTRARRDSSIGPLLCLLCFSTMVVETICQREQGSRGSHGTVPACGGQMSRPVIAVCVEEGYSKLTRPDPPAEPTYVHIKIRFNDIEEVNDMHQTITLHMHMTVMWEDKRVSVVETGSNDTRDQGKVLDEELSRGLWMPDFAIYSLKSFDYAHILKRLATMKVYRNSTLMYSFQTRTTVTCQFNFDKYPMDKQDCYFMVGSYGYTSEEMVYGGEYFHPQERQRPLPVTVTIRDLKMSERKVEAKNDTGQVVAIYSVYGLIFHTERGINSFIFRTYFPSAMGVFVSWTSFMLRQDAVAGRLSLLVTLTWMQINIYRPLTKDSPPSLKVSAIEVWVIFCLVSVSAALLEFALVIYKKSPLEQKRREHVRSKLLSKISSMGDRDRSHSHEREKHKGKSLKDLRGRVQHGIGHNPAQGCCAVVKNCFDTNYIDICSLIFFPTAFIVFNIWYWMYYKSKDEKKNG